MLYGGGISIEFLSYAGILFLPFFATGMWEMWKNRQKALSILSLGLVSMVGMCMQKNTHVRWAYSFYICFILIIGYGMIEIWQSRLIRRHTVGKAVFLAVLLLIGVNQVSGTVFGM